MPLLSGECKKSGSFRNRNRAVQRLFCKRCGISFSESQPFDGLRIDHAKVIQIVKLFSEGLGVRAISRLTDCHIHTVLSALETVGERLLAADNQTATAGRYEYVTIRWAGPENTHIIRPGGQVEFVGAELRKVHKPNRADDHSFYLNCAMNGLTKEGYEFAGISNDDIVMKRLAR